MWTSRTADSYLTVNVHFIDQDFNFVSKVLATVNFHTSHTSRNITDKLWILIDDFKLHEKISHIVTDNGANIVYCL